MYQMLFQVLLEINLNEYRSMLSVKKEFTELQHSWLCSVILEKKNKNDKQEKKALQDYARQK